MWVRVKFSEYIAWVFGGLNSPDLHFSFNVVLSDSMMTDVDAATMLVNGGTGGNVLSCLAGCP